MENNQLNEEKEFVAEEIVATNRVSKAVKGGRHISFSAIVVIGDKKGRVGVGTGKANEVAIAINKAKEDARKNVFSVPIRRGTIPHEILGKFGGSKVLMKPAAEGTGVIAGGPVRVILQAAGIENILAKSLGSNTKHNLVNATITCLKSLRSHEEVALLRKKSITELLQ
ncbi:MAG: 30S ribosomal protein S5 [Candidatus Cloacimonadia bacterium]